MEEVCARHGELHNAALEHRVNARKRQRIGITFVDRAHLLKEAKEARPEDRAITHDALNATLRRRDLAMQAFSRRVEAGERFGLPRFKSRRR